MPFKRRHKIIHKRKPKKTLAKPMKRAVDKEIKKYFKKELEVKHTQYELDQAVTTTPIIAVGLFHPAQGVSAYNNEDTDAGEQGQRVGNTITIVDIEIKGVYVVGDPNNILRMVWFQWMEDGQSSVPTYSDIFLENTTSYPYNALYNPDTKQKYKILYDKTHVLATSSGGSSPSIIAFHTHIKPPIRKIVYSGDAANGYTSSIIKGGIYYILMSDSVIVANPSITWSLMMKYTDA